MDTFQQENPEFANNVYNNMMSLFFNPEINKRKQEGRLPENFELVAAQVIFFPDGNPYIVRLNDEVSVEVKLKKGVNKEDKDFWPSSSDIVYVKLNEEEFLNCGHCTLILLNDGFQLSFDFHYNKQICSEHLFAADQFLKTTKYALDNNLIAAFIDNAFSSIELLAKTNLLLEANQSVFGKTHGVIQSAFNQRHKNSQVQFEIQRRQVFNQLSNARGKARYVRGVIDIDQNELVSIYETIREMLEDLCNRSGVFNVHP